MNRLTNRALAAACAIALVFGTATAALADRDGGHGHAKTHAQSGRHANQNDDRQGNENGEHHGKSSSAHNCINPAGNTRGWCKQHNVGTFVTGTVTAINGNTATVALTGGQTVTINSAGLTVGQQITLRGTWQNGVFVPSGRPYTNYGGPYSGASVRGTILSINGNSLQLLRGLSITTVDFSNASSRGAINGTLVVGRSITANGSWNGSTFIATSIQ